MKKIKLDGKPLVEILQDLLENKTVTVEGVEHKASDLFKVSKSVIRVHIRHMPRGLGYEAILQPHTEHETVIHVLKTGEGHKFSLMYDKSTRRIEIPILRGSCKRIPLGVLKTFTTDEVCVIHTAIQYIEEYL